jgi:hypothetical protein
MDALRRARQRAGRLRDASGANLVEAAIALPLLLLLTFGIADFGTFFYGYLALENGVSQATRFAITGNQLTDSGGAVLSRQDSIIAAMRQATPTLSIPVSAFRFEHMSPGGSGWVGGTGGPNDIERVTVNYNWQFMTPLVRPFFPGGQVTLSVESTMKNEGRFQ